MAVLSAPAGDWLSRHPEWWALAVSGAAWLVLVLGAQTPAALCHAPFSGTGAGLLDWGLMIGAMMPPLTIPALRHVACRSFGDRRHRAMAEFLAAYLGVWLSAGLAVVPLLAAADALGPTARPALAAVGYGVAAAWQLAPCKQRALLRCHRRAPLAAFGWRADADCIRFGLTSGGSCLASCWALMAGPVLTAHGLAAMACVQAVMLRERYQLRMIPRPAASLPLICLAFLLDLHDGLG